MILWDEVGETEGTGIVHIAPGCGAEDFQLGPRAQFPAGRAAGRRRLLRRGLWLADRASTSARSPTPIFEDLERKGLLYQVEPYTHRYPTCWRCKTELVFRLVDEWFISMGEVYDKPREALTAEEKERSLRYQIMDVVDQIRWIPEFGYCARDGLAAQHARLDDQQEALLGAGAADLGLREVRQVRGDRRRDRAEASAPSPAGMSSTGIPRTARSSTRSSWNARTARDA